MLKQHAFDELWNVSNFWDTPAMDDFLARHPTCTFSVQEVCARKDVIKCWNTFFRVHFKISRFLGWLTNGLLLGAPSTLCSSRRLPKNGKVLTKDSIEWWNLLSRWMLNKCVLRDSPTHTWLFTLLWRTIHLMPFNVFEIVCVKDSIECWIPFSVGLLTFLSFLG